MKKYFVMLLSAAIAFSSCACGGETTEKTEEKKTVKTGESVPHRTGDEIVGVSDKDVNVLDVIFRDSIREDSTGNWRLAMASTSEDFLSYAASYYENYFKSDDETHFFTIQRLAQLHLLQNSQICYVYICMTMSKGRNIPLKKSQKVHIWGNIGFISTMVILKRLSNQKILIKNPLSCANRKEDSYSGHTWYNPP